MIRTTQVASIAGCVSCQDQAYQVRDLHICRKVALMHKHRHDLEEVSATSLQVVLEDMHSSAFA